MRVLKIEKTDKPVIEVEQKFLFWKKVRKFKAVSETIKDKYWVWLEIPDMIRVPTSLSFQLDAWLRCGRDN